MIWTTIALSGACALIVRNARLARAAWRSFIRAAAAVRVEDGVLPRSVGMQRLSAEIAWARRTGVPYALVAMRTYGTTANALHVGILARRRAHETVTEIDARTLVVGVWDIDALGAARAVARLATAARGEQQLALDVALAVVPDDGTSVSGLVSVMANRLRSHEEVRDAVAEIPLEPAAPQVRQVRCNAS